MNLATRERFNVEIGGIDTDARIWWQYKEMINFIFSNYNPKKARFEPIAIPMLFLITHAIELGLKENIKYLKKYSQSSLLTKFQSWAELVKSHNLSFLAREFKSQFKKTCKKLKVDQSLEIEFNDLFEKLEIFLNYLEGGTGTYRYAKKLDKNAEETGSSFNREKRINFLEVRNDFKEVDKLLTHTADVISEYTDYIDLIEKHPAYREKGKGYLFCLKLWYDDYTEKQLRKTLDEMLLNLSGNKWLDKETGEIWELVIFEGFLYVI